MVGSQSVALLSRRFAAHTSPAPDWADGLPVPRIAYWETENLRTSCRSWRVCSWARANLPMLRDEDANGIAATQKKPPAIASGYPVVFPFPSIASTLWARLMACVASFAAAWPDAPLELPPRPVGTCLQENCQSEQFHVVFGIQTPSRCEASFPKCPIEGRL